jgi:hypothetical protein
LYISEIVDAIILTTYKATDVSNMVKLCVCLHRRYEDFTPPLCAGLRSSLLSPLSEEDPEAGKKRRIQIRFVVELYQGGLFLDEEFFPDLLRYLLGGRAPSRAGSAPAGGRGQPMDLPGLSTFVKYASEVLVGFVPRKLSDLAGKAGKALGDMPTKTIALPRVSNEMKQMITETFSQLSGDLVHAHKQFRSKERRTEKDRVIHGSITEQKQLELDNAKRLFEKLLSVVTSLAECLNEKIPELEVRDLLLMLKFFVVRFFYLGRKRR